LILAEGVEGLELLHMRMI